MKNRVTTSDIARAAGVHQTTVSLALRGDTRLKAETVTRIKAVAKRLGYVPDPMLAALASYRRARRPHGPRGTIAWVTNWPTRDGWRLRPMFVQFFDGAQRRATELGYRLEEFWLHEGGLTPQRASGVLQARGVQGLILPPQPDDVSGLALTWEWFSAVTIGPTLREPELHMVSNNQYRTVHRLCRALAERGYRRIGYAIERRIDERMDGQWSAAFDRFQRDLPEERRISRFEEPLTTAALRRWLRATAPDVVVGCSDELAQLLAAPSGRRASCKFALVGVGHATTGCAGMHEDAAMIGTTAVDRVTALINLGERGIPRLATRTLIDATWVEAVA